MSALIAGPDDYAACRELLRDGSRTFHAASVVLPMHVRLPAIALYAFCRVADDAIDNTTIPVVALTRLRERLDRVYAGQPFDIPADRAFAATVREFNIPRELPEALLDGFAWDTERRRYRTLADVYAYGTRVAGSVGVMMTLLMGVRDARVLARACDLGIAMQLTNIARDVGEDARNGRLYLPLDWLAEVGIDPDVWLAEPRFGPEIAVVVKRLLAAADVLYVRASAGIGDLPGSCRAGIHAARLLYAEIGREVERRGLDSISQRAVVHWARKATRGMAALVAAARRTPTDCSHTVAQAQYLIDAVEQMPLPAVTPVDRPARAMGFDERIAWVMDLFERLDERDARLGQTL
jgi:phytoene synthase